MGQIKYNEDRRTPTQFECSTPSSDMDESSPAEPYNMPVELDGPAPDNPLMSSLLPGPPPQGVQLMPPGASLHRQAFFFSNPSQSNNGKNLTCIFSQLLPPSSKMACPLLRFLTRYPSSTLCPPVDHQVRSPYLATPLRILASHRRPFSPSRSS